MYKRILVPTDGSETAQNGLVEAIALARTLKAQLVLLNVVDDLGWLAVDTSDALRRDISRHGEQVLAQGRQLAAASDIASDSVLREVVGKRAAEAIVDVAQEKACDLIVMGTHGRRALSRAVLGSDAAAVVAASPVPVLLVRNRHPRP